MILISWTLPLAVCAAKAFPLRQAQIARKIDDSHLLESPARCVRRQGFSFEAGQELHGKSMILISWTLPLAVCTTKASPLRQAQIAGKAMIFHLFEIPVCCVRSQGFFFEVGPGGRESQ